MGKLIQMSLKSDFNLKDHNITKLTHEQIKEHFYRSAVYYLKKPLNELQCIDDKFVISDSLIQNRDKKGECVPCDNNKTYVYDEKNDLNFRCYDTTTTDFYNKLYSPIQKLTTSVQHMMLPSNYVKTELYSIPEERTTYGYKTYTLRGNWYNNRSKFPSEFDGVGYLQGFYLYAFNEGLRNELNDGFPVSKCAGIYHSNKHVITGIFNFYDNDEYFDDYIQGGLGNVYNLHTGTKQIDTKVKYMGEWKINYDLSGKSINDIQNVLTTYEKDVSDSEKYCNDNINKYTKQYDDDIKKLQDQLSVLNEEKGKGIKREWESSGRNMFEWMFSTKLTCEEEIEQVNKKISKTKSDFIYNKKWYEDKLESDKKHHDDRLKYNTKYYMIPVKTKNKEHAKLIADIKKNIENEKEILEKRIMNNGVEYHGYGTLSNTYSASTYSGNWVNGKKHGYGYYFDTKLEYNGQWNYDVYNGKGTLQYFWNGKSKKYNNKQQRYNDKIKIPGYNKYDALRELPIERIDGTWNNSKIEGPATINYFNQESYAHTEGEKGFDVFYIDDENLKEKFKKQYYFIEEINSIAELNELKEYMINMLSEITMEYKSATKKLAEYTTPSIQLIHSDKMARGIFAGFMIAILFCIIGPFAYFFTPVAVTFTSRGTDTVSRPMKPKEDTAKLQLDAKVEKTEHEMRLLNGLLSTAANNNEENDPAKSGGGYNKFSKTNKKRRRNISKINKKWRRTISKRIYR